MSVCDLSTGIARLTHAFSELKLRLTETFAEWHDEVRREFEENYLRDLPVQMQMTINAAQRLAEELRTAERECGDFPDQTDA